MQATPERMYGFWVRKLSPGQGNFQSKPEAFPAIREKNHLLVKGNLGGTLQHSLHVEAETQILGHLMQRANSFEKTLMLGKIEAEGDADNRG